MRHERSIVVGERANVHRVVAWELLLAEDPDAWLEVSLERGAFRGDERSWAKLSSIGVEATDRRSFNLLPPAPSGSVEWSRLDALRVAACFLPYARDYQRIFLCGKRVARAFGLRNVSTLSRFTPFVREGEIGRDDWKTHATYYELSECESAAHELIVLPHPSGRNRWWNDSTNVERARRVLLARR